MAEADDDTIIILLSGVFLLFIGQIMCNCWVPVRGIRWFFGLLITMLGVLILFSTPFLKD